MKLSTDLASGKALVSEVAEAGENCGRELLGQLATRAAALSDGDTQIVDIDWTVVRLRAESQTVVAEEPDYARNAGEFVPSLSVTCHILGLQRKLLGTLNAEDQPVGGQQYARVSLEALRAASVVGHRLKDDEKPFTGWQIVSTAPVRNQNYGLYSIRELAAQRLEWLVAMRLPTGWSFRYVGRTLVDCVSLAGRTFELNLSVEF